LKLIGVLRLTGEVGEVTDDDEAAEAGGEGAEGEATEGEAAEAEAADPA
jgi:hypothetical protein